ncbi:hypothetical protein [Alkalihalobacterium chitinilyticum]|uniref:Uncharacterized protein n=1 Tax=Alkalihalobacterium chitinilyticum TaxID=2980103 RepID=A0ABT5VCQ5_9BACI|nr:hypothetical protein [Alkalihalobacterium chitinilyticum]MDE5413229.1 hypothetical protein [Alkalihalobacterium chitinilyticum]
MNGLIEIDEPSRQDQIECGAFTIETVQCGKQLNDMTAVCQFFAALDVITGQDALTILPTPTKKAEDIIMNELVPHYQDVKKIVVDEKLVEINVRFLKEGSKKIVKQRLVQGELPFVHDLYRTEPLNIPAYPRELKYYLIDKKFVKPVHTKEAKEIGDFVKSSFFARDGVLSLTPRGWNLEEELLNAVSIRTFASFADRIILVVDREDLSIVGLDLYG